MIKKNNLGDSSRKKIKFALKLNWVSISQIKRWNIKLINFSRKFRHWKWKYIENIQKKWIKKKNKTIKKL